MRKNVKRIGDAILAHVRFVMHEIAEGDADFEFKLNRWIFSHLLSDSRKQSKPIKQKLWDSGMRSCQICKKKFSSIKGVEIHRKDSCLDYSVKNCELLCRSCHQKPITDNVQAGAGPEEKIGQFARRTFNQLFSGKKLTQEMLENLQDTTYSKKTFGIPYPILQRIDPNRSADEQRLDNKGRARYWSQEFDNGRYLMCSQWYEKHRENLTQWASQFE